MRFKTAAVLGGALAFIGLLAIGGTPGAEETTDRTLDPDDAASVIYLDSEGKEAGTGDPTITGFASEAAKQGMGDHPAALRDKRLPMDQYGLVDWVKLQQSNLIKPRFSTDPQANPDDEEIFDADVLFESKGDYTPDVIYPHDIHTWWLKCEICHESANGAIFNPEVGSNKVLMVDIVEGKFCGRCHGTVAFPLTDCKRCHVRPKGAPKDDTLLVRPINY